MKKARFSAGLLAISSELDSYGVAHKLVRATVAEASAYPALKPLAKWKKEEDEDSIDGGLYYTLKSPGSGGFIIALEDTGWIVIHEYKTQQALGRNVDGRFFASGNLHANNKAIHFASADEAWYALSAIWKKLDIRKMERFDDALPTNTNKAVVATASASIWIVRGPKGRTQNECPKTALAEYVKLYGSRGNITVSENKREGDFLAFTAGCKSFKGTVKEVMPKLEAECK